MILVLFGPPGSGKGTQSQFLIDKYAFTHVSTGNILREEIKKETSLGSEIKKVVDSGQFVSDDLICRLVEGVIKKNQEKDIIFDGFPRTVVQAEKFDAILSQLGKKIDLVLDFVVDFDKLKDRITGRYTCSSCGAVYNDCFNKPKVEGVCDACSGTAFERRRDDSLEVLQERVRVYRDETEAAVQHYVRAGVVKKIDASEELNVVKNNVADCLRAGGFIKD